MAGGAGNAEGLRIDERQRDRGTERDGERHEVAAAHERRFRGEREGERDPDRVPAVQVRPEQDERRDRDERAARAGARAVEEVEHHQEEDEREDGRAIGPAGLRDH